MHLKLRENISNGMIVQCAIPLVVSIACRLFTGQSPEILMHIIVLGVITFFLKRVYTFHYPLIQLTEDQLKIDDHIKIDLDDIDKSKSAYRRKKLKIFLHSEPERCPIIIDFKLYTRESVAKFKEFLKI